MHHVSNFDAGACALAICGKVILLTGSASAVLGDVIKLTNDALAFYAEADEALLPSLKLLATTLRSCARDDDGFPKRGLDCLSLNFLSRLASFLGIKHFTSVAVEILRALVASDSDSITAAVISLPSGVVVSCDVLRC